MLKKNNILQILSLSYPILTHIAISQNEFKLALLMLGIIAGLFILNRSKQPEKTPNFFFDLALWIGLIIFRYLYYFCRRNIRCPLLATSSYTFIFHFQFC